MTLSRSIILTALSLLTLLQAAPNVIVVLTDDLGFGDIYDLHQHKRDNGAGGGVPGDRIINGSEEAFINTPYLDRMIAEGAKLTRHYTSAPVCAPARGSLIQGRDQGHANIRNNSFDKVISDNHTLGTVLQQAGYFTASVGKWGVGGNGPSGAGLPNKRGFDYFYGYIRHIHGHQHYPGNGGTVYEASGIGTTPTAIKSGLDHAYTTDLWTAKTKQIIQDRHNFNTANPNSAKPFFIYLAYDAPHAQLQVPTQAYPSGLGTSGGLTWPLNTNSGTNDSWIHPDYLSLGNAAARHATMVRRIDTCMGDILQTLRDLNIDDNTLVIFTSDNGTHNESGSGGSVAHNPRNFDSFGELEGIKRDHWEGGIRMPTFAWWPTQIGDNNPATPGYNSTRPSAFWDWLPTLVDAAGLTPPAFTNGVSLLPELTGQGAQADKGYLYFEYSVGGSTPNYSEFPNHGGTARGEMQSIFLDHSDGKRYKGIRTNVSSHSKDFAIYDVDADPNESSNLASSLPELQQKMKDRVLQVRIDGDYNRSYLSTTQTPPASPPTVINGLDFKTFSGSWPWVPETTLLAPATSGTTSNPDLSVRDQDSNFAIEFTGFLTIPTDGTYTFYMTADTTVSNNQSGAMLWLHDANLIDDDYNHNSSTRSASMRLKAGLHPIRILYKHSTGTHDLKLEYSGPNIARQTIPNSAYFRAGSPPAEPQAQDDHATTTGTTPVDIPVLNNDSDDGAPGPLNILSLTQPQFGSATINGNQITYTANANQFGTDHLSYTITDGEYTATAHITINVQVPISNLWIPLDETTGNSVSEAGGTPIGIHSGFSNSEASHVIGKHGHALSFDGVDDQINLSNITLPTGSSPRTLSAWIKTSATTGVENQVIFGYGQNSNGQRFSFRLDGTTTQRLRLEVQGGFIVGTTPLNDGQWHHVAVVIDDFDTNGSTNVNEAHLYVDGLRETISSSGSQTINTSAAGSPTIAASSHANGYNFTGSIDDIRSHHSALTTSEITQLYNAQNQPEASWAFRHFGTTNVDWSADTDSDSHSLLEEFAFGGSPHAPAPLTQQSAITSSKLTFHFTQRAPGTHNLQYHSEATTNLIDWNIPTTITNTVTHPTLGPPYQQITVESNLDTNTTPRQFIRVRIE
ncbi:sulfatase-like hydrolase/transferase [Rubritalea tangerina]|uniref:Sulfatase-like hydrolase/transferase n=1 Tax=Rubritalea tangerina TaxID=430798 RepID=A0ABW4ZC82_9BACT